MGEEAERNRQALQGFAIQGCVMLCVASTEVVTPRQPFLPPPPPHRCHTACKHLGDNLLSLQETRGEDQHPQRLPSDSKVTASGPGEWQITGEKFHWAGGKPLLLFTDKRRGSQKTRDVSNTTPKAARMGFFSNRSSSRMRSLQSQPY